MPKIRTVKPDLFRHETLFEAEKKYQLPLRIAFIGLLTCCDRKGRFRWRARQLKLDILPYDDLDFEKILTALLNEKFICQYQFEDEVYGYIPSWEKHQVINPREPKSFLPDPENCLHAQENTLCTKNTALHVQDNATHMQDSAMHVQNSATHMQDSATHVQDSATHVQNSATHMQDSATHVQNNEMHVLAPLEMEMEMEMEVEGKGNMEMERGKEVEKELDREMAKDKEKEMDLEAAKKKFQGTQKIRSRQT